MKLESSKAIKYLAFDIPGRKLEVFHTGEVEKVHQAIIKLKLNEQLVGTKVAELPISSDDSRQRKIFWWVLGINLGFFIIEMTTGWISRSMGLVADSLDMLADALVYGLGLWAVGSTIRRKKRVARLSGYFQLLLATAGIFEVVRRFISFETLPDFHTMIVVSILALIANSISLYLLQKSRSKDAHVKATMICTSNDVIINSGVILAGILVLITNSRYPDLIIGALVFIIVVKGAFRILNLSK